jgi:hypothetical protein
MAVLAGSALAALLAGILIGRATATRGRAQVTAVMTEQHGIPIGTLHTEAGALAAADNYLAIASQTLEQGPATFARLLQVAYTPAARARTQTQATQIRSGDSSNMTNYAEGGRAIALVAARRLDRYTATGATVTTWLGGLEWGPALTPRQSWNLIDTTLVWQHGRWLVASQAAEKTPAPVPSIVYLDGRSNESSAFDQRLAGMSAPFYGTG